VGRGEGGKASRGRRFALFDHLVGERVQLERDVEADRLGGLEVEHEFEAGRLGRNSLSALTISAY
jgi:hypothetical protein